MASIPACTASPLLPISPAIAVAKGELATASTSFTTMGAVGNPTCSTHAKKCPIELKIFIALLVSVLIANSQQLMAIS